MQPDINPLGQQNIVSRSNFGRDRVFRELYWRGDYKEYVLTLIQKYDKKASNRKFIHNILQITIFIGAAVAAIIVTIPGVSKFIPALLSGCVALATAMINYYKFGDRSRDFQILAENMALEYNKFATGRGSYEDKDEKEALHIFMDQVEVLLSEQTQRSIALEKLRSDQRQP